jgi:hypothetical protein
MGGTAERKPMASGSGTPDDPWALLTPSGGSEFTMHVDADSSPPLLICKVGKTHLTYLARALDDLNAFLVERGDWVLLGAADEQRPAMEGTVDVSVAYFGSAYCCFKSAFHPAKTYASKGCNSHVIFAGTYNIHMSCLQAWFTISRWI